MTPEGKVKAKVKSLFKRFKVWNFLPVSNGMGAHGIPDIIACVPVVVTQDMVGDTVGLFLGVETKAGGKTAATSRQKMQAMKIQEAGGIAVLVNMERVDKLEKVLIKLTNKI